MRSKRNATLTGINQIYEILYKILLVTLDTSTEAAKNQEPHHNRGTLKRLFTFGMMSSSSYVT